MHRVKKDFLANDSGTVAMIVAIGLGLGVFLGFAALALDIAHMVSVRRELVKAAEAGALAGARGLWPQNLWQTTGTTHDQTSTDWTRAQTSALDAATSNKADGPLLAASEVTVEIGKWDYTTKQFTAGNNVDDNACRVRTRKTNVRMSFAQIFGISSENMSASATAIMDFIGGVGRGSIPIVLNKIYVADLTTIPRPPLTIYAGAANTDNGGWFTVPPDSTAASTLSGYINKGTCPELWCGEIINLQNGQDTSFLKDLWTKLQASSSTPKELDCVLPVVNTNAFNQDGEVIGFVPFKITEVDDHGTKKSVTGTVLTWGELENALPGGGKFGALAPPKLVQ